MKKHIIILAAIFAAALLAPACYPEDAPGLKSEGITLSLYSDEPETKAFDSTFETVIDHFDFYFFDDEPGTQPIENLHGRATGSSIQLDTRTGRTYAKLRKGGKYVYIIANYPGSHPTTSHNTLEELLALEVNSPILTGRVTATNPATGKVEETGAVTFCDNLVMDSYHKDGSNEKYTVKIPAPTAVNESRTVTVGLSRLAAKLKMVVNVASNVQGSLGGEVWNPVMSDFKAYYVNALNNKTTVGATPIARPVDTTGYGYITYPTAYPVTISGNTATTDPVFTYPQTWAVDANGEPYFKIQMTWESNLRGTSPFYYKVRVPRAAADGKCTLKRNTFTTVTVALSVVDTDSDYVTLDGTYVVTSWAEGLPAGGSGLSAARFFNVPRKQYDLDNMASVPVPYYSSSAISAYFTNITYSYYGASNGVVATYEFRYTKADNKTSLTLPTTDSNGHTVATNARETNEYSLTWDSKNVTFEHSMTNIYTARTITFVIEKSDTEKETVTIVQHPAIEIKTKETVNGFVNGYFARATANVKDADGNLIGTGPYRATTFGGGDYYHSTNYWYTNSSGARVGSDASTLYNLGIINGSCSTSVHADCMFITEVTVHAFDSENGTDRYQITYSGNGDVDHRPGSATKYYRVGDPRMPAGELFDGSTAARTIPPYLYSDKNHRSGPTATADVTEDWTTPMQILIANRGASADEVIAPKFLVSSNFNNMSSWPLSN